MNSRICPLPQPQSDTDPPPSFYPLLLWKCGLCPAASHPPKLLLDSAVWLLASPLWKQWKNLEATSWNPGAFPWLASNSTCLWSLKCSHTPSNILVPALVVLATFYWVTSLFSHSSLHSPNSPAAKSFVIHDRARFLSQNSPDLLVPHLIFPETQRSWLPQSSSKGWRRHQSGWVWTFFHFYSSLSLNSSSLYPTSMPSWGPPRCEVLCCMLLRTRMLIPHSLFLYRAPQLMGVGGVEVAELMFWLPGGKAIWWELQERGAVG